MNIERLFKVLVVTGASSSAGLVGCGGDSGPSTPSGTGGGHASGGSSNGTGGSSSGDGGASGSAGASGAAGAAASCDCKPSTTLASWTDCNGCCCWLAVGQTTMTGSPICGEEPCCHGKGGGR